ncbi:hypothetical protein A3J43_00980 [Candidatus Uhrbacteria bacterium RIFCSPHIGHO2_12_FULL_54_23]|uniref:Addiction module toxin RelE n=2 Tax=Candidatus Uhriibacteriota TaxID=1752732 RepID=A0A1F7UJY6_9BACT|nr:MAG: hypothetical protein A3J43_00980 [Candidatus Uhrbacteria bacterium RIFCSPHIGHO2_12_FULL_54_23]OGL91015.1 MAG: hypothetical protein A3J36_01740 [Candidatus Uhrbacteria bacterium RIFCSPLOWO2_02_FULL_54_37]
MRYFITEHFKRQLKLILKKHHLSLDDLIKDLERFDERQAVSLGAGAYKIRLRLRDLPKGKSSSFRLIVLYVKQEELIAPLTIYAKSDRDTIDKKEIITHARAVRAELEHR